MGARYLANRNSEKVSLIGAGPIIRPQIMALQFVLPTLKEVSIFDLSGERAEKLAGKLRPRERFVSMGSIILKRNPGRENPKERIFFNPGGMGIEDVAAAHRVYLNALNKGIGKELELWHDPLWI